MALAVLPAIIVSFVIVVASLGTFYIYRAYRRVRYAVHDVERSHHIEIAGLSQQRSIELHDLEGPRKQYHSGQWYGSESVVPTHVAPAAKPLPHTPEIEYSGGEGLVRPPGRVFLSTGVQQPELLSPKPVRTVTTRPKAEPASTAYDPDQTAASEIWNKIEKGELDPSRRKAQKKFPKKPNAPVPEVLRDPSEFERDTMIDVDLDNSTREWAKPNRPALPFTPRLNKRESSDSMATVVDANNANIERPQSYVKRKQSIGTGAIKPSEPLDRAAEARRQMTERKKQMVERQKQEEADRLAEEQRLVDEQKQRAAEQQRLAEEKQRQEDEATARSLAQISDDEDIDLDDKRPSESQRPRTRRRSDSSSKSKRERKSRETLLTRTPKRAYTFANDASDGIDNPNTDEKTSSNSKGSSRSMSMNDQARPDFNATMPSIAEGAHVDPFSDNAARWSYGSIKKSVSSMYSPDHISLNDGEGNYTSRPADYKRRAAPEDTLENPFASDNDPQDPFATAQRSSAASSNDSRVSFSQVQRRSNASSNESRNSSGTNYPKRSDSKASAKNRASVDSQSSQQSARGREKPERKPSVASRAFSKISRKSSSSDKKKERDSASSTQSREHEGPVLRGGGKMYVEEPEELSSSEDEHEDRTKQEQKVKNGAEMRGGSGEKDESEIESEVEVETEHEDESDAAEVGHSEDEHSDVSSSDEDEIESEKHDSSEEEGSGDDDDASEDGDSESEISDAGTSDAITSDDESEEEVSDDEQGPVLKKPIEVVGVPAGNAGRVKA